MTKGLNDDISACLLDFSHRLKVQQIQPINPNQFFIVKTQGTFQSQRSFGLSYDWCCTSCAALICHQAKAVTTELLLHHCLFCHQNQQAGVATQAGMCTQILQQSHLGTCHQSGSTAQSVKPPLICYHDIHRGWPETEPLFNLTGWMRWWRELVNILKTSEINLKQSRWN